MSKGPDFIGIGAHRSATTWLYECLAEHPEVCLVGKELNFFCDEKRWLKGLRWYESFFEKCSSNPKTGEYSTFYLSNPLVADRIHKNYPQVKVIISLRNPIERAISNYFHELRIGLLDKSVSFSEALKLCPNFIERGKYATHLKNYLNFFSRDQILIIIYDDLVQKPLEIIQNVYKFISVDPSFIPTKLRARINQSALPRWSKFAKLEYLGGQLGSYLQKNGLGPFWFFLGEWGLKKLFFAINVSEYINTSDLFVEERRCLQLIFREEIKELEKIINRKLDWQ